MHQISDHNPLTESVTPLFSHKKYREEPPAPFLPMSRAEMDALGWDQCDVIVVTGDAYIDHPSFGMAIIGRLLEAQGFRVGIIAQPDWHGVADFQKLGAPRLFWGVTAGNMDSMVNRYTSDKRLRHDDAYTPNGEGGKRPDRATIIYTGRCHQAAPGVPVVLGGIESSLRRLAHYDYWSDKIRRSILFDSKADMIIYGNAERALTDVAFRIADKGIEQDFADLRGLALIKKAVPEGYRVLHAEDLDTPEETRGPIEKTVIRIPSYEEVVAEKEAYARASRVFHRESNPGNAHAIVQAHGNRELWMTPPPIPLTTPEMDGVYELPFARAPHPSYGKARIPAWDMIKTSVTILRGCFGGCAFCSITEHEGRIIQSRSEKSVLKEICKVRDKTEGFAGIISDIGGPTANMYRMACKSPAAQAVCKRPSCVYPDICKNMNTSHEALIRLYKKARNLPGIRKIMIASGVRYDLAVKSPEYIRELVTYHLSGYLKIAPEHTEPGPLAHMMKPGIATYDRFKEIFDQATKAAGKKYFLIPYFIAAHPGTTDEDMLNLALWLKKNNFRPDQVQTYLASPMALSTAMYYSGYNPLKPVRHGASEPVETVKGGRQRRLHKAFLRYHDPENWPLLRAALREMGRADLIGPRADQLIPLYDKPVYRDGPQRRGPGQKKPFRADKGAAHEAKTFRPTRRKAAERGEESLPWKKKSSGGKNHYSRASEEAESFNKAPSRKGAPGGRKRFSDKGPESGKSDWKTSSKKSYGKTHYGKTSPEGAESRNMTPSRKGEPTRAPGGKTRFGKAAPEGTESRNKAPSWNSRPSGAPGGKKRFGKTSPEGTESRNKAPSRNSRPSGPPGGHKHKRR